MKITRQLGRDGTLGPLALNYLPGIPENLLFFREQQLRHPAALYSLHRKSVETSMQQQEVQAHISGFQRAQQHGDSLPGMWEDFAVSHY